MKKVITYGTYDLLHYGHIRLLERAKALGDYLIVGITSEAFDKARGKINVQQSLMERIAAVRATGLADKIIVEEYEGQKIDDIQRYDVDIFAIGSDWKDKFDYLKEYCQVVYLDRTEGVSSSDIRTEQRQVKLGLVGDPRYLLKISRESKFVNGLVVTAICTNTPKENIVLPQENLFITQDYSKMLKEVDAIYLISHPSRHYDQIKQALLAGKHVLCEAPLTIKIAEFDELTELAQKQKCIFMPALKTAYSMAYYRLILLAKTGKIGKIVSVDATCTSLQEKDSINLNTTWNSLCYWGPAALLPVFQLLGTEYKDKNIVSQFFDKKELFDNFTKIDFYYPDAVASIKVGKGVKSEGELIISGTKGYIFVPAPWWKTDYFEIRYEDPNQNRRYFYQLEGEGIRYELVSFVKAITSGRSFTYIDSSVSRAMCGIMEDFYSYKLKEIN